MIKLSGFFQPSGIVDFRAAVKAGRAPWVTAANAVSSAAAARSGRKPNAVATWYTPGVYQDAAGFNAAMQPFIGDCDAAFATSLDGYLKDQAAPTAQKIVRAWTTINKGVSTYTGSQGNDSYLAMCTEGNGLVHAAILLDTQTHYGWSPTDQQNARHWVSTYYVPIGKDILVRQHMTNNWADWACYALALSAYYLPDANLRAWVEQTLRAHIIHAIDPATGLMPEEMARGSAAVNYMAFSLIPMISACLVIDAAGGTNLLEDAQIGPLVRKSVDVELSMLSPLKTGMSPAQHDACDLYELAGAIYNSGTYKQYAAPYRPILTLGHHLSLATPSTLTAVILPPTVPQRRVAWRRSTDSGPLDSPAPAADTPTTIDEDTIGEPTEPPTDVPSGEPMPTEPDADDAPAQVESA